MKAGAAPQKHASTLVQPSPHAAPQPTQHRSTLAHKLSPHLPSPLSHGQQSPHNPDTMPPHSQQGMLSAKGTNELSPQQPTHDMTMSACPSSKPCHSRHASQVCSNDTCQHTQRPHKQHHHDSTPPRTARRNSHTPCQCYQLPVGPWVVKCMPVHAHSLLTAGGATRGAERRQHKHAELSEKYDCKCQQHGGCPCREQHLVAQWNGSMGLQACANNRGTCGSPPKKPEKTMTMAVQQQCSSSPA